VYPPSPPTQTQPYTPVSAPRPVIGRNASGSLDGVLMAREEGQHERRRTQRDEEVMLVGEGVERHSQMLALMSSSPPSSPKYDDDEDEPTDNEDEDDRLSAKTPSRAGPSHSRLGLGRPMRINTFQLGRATSFDLAASSSRARNLIPAPRISSGPINSLPPFNYGAKRMVRPVPTHTVEPVIKRQRPNPAFKPRDSFSRSQSSAVLAGPPTSPIAGDADEAEGSRPSTLGMEAGRKMQFWGRKPDIKRTEACAFGADEEESSMGNEDKGKGKTNGREQGQGKEGDVEEIIGAAQSLLEMFSSGSHTSGSQQSETSSVA
jgi:hypothetical protein